MRKFLPFIIIGIVVVILLVKFWPSLGFLPKATRLVFHPGATLKEVNGKTNVVLLGIGGGSHDGPNLTDTIIFASIDWKKNTVTLVSIPRDLWVPSLPTYVKKINEAYQVGLDDTPPNGIQNAETVVSSVVGQPIQYGIRLDFQGFVDAIDQIGGVDVQVARTLDDYNYPISGKEDDTCSHSPDEINAFNASESASLTPEQDAFDFYACRYKHLHFDPGLQHMNGQDALEFVRSRHAVGIEGSDFARSQRQQLVIEAVRSKMISAALFNPGKILGLYGIMKQSIDTDMTETDLGLFLDKLPALKDAKIISGGLDTGDYTTGRLGLLKNTPVSAEFDYSAALMPRIGNGDFSEIQKYVKCEITVANCPIPALTLPTNSQ